MKNKIHHAMQKHQRKAIVIVTIIALFLGSYLLYFRFFGALPQSTAYLFQTLSAPDKNDRIIIFSPHPDDETLGAGGYVATARDVGAEVYIIFATDGNHLHLKDRRHTEALAAAAALGVPADHLIFYNYPDTHLAEHDSELKAAIQQTILQINPTKMFVTDPVDIHPDHSELGRAVSQVNADKQPTRPLYTFLIHFQEYPRPQQFRPHNFLLPPISLISQTRQWLRFDLTTADFDKKNEAVLQYKSQLRTPFLHSLMLAFVRQNEIFSVYTP